ncbi:glycosyltransferase [Aquabacterium sp.]|uniref:glycosyltransferase n=1 Tax=Aquabacterium sp. TaxID=1872578 RepID=UPI002489342E|nr:glycosyltransferase [Aquabacterium sp.]MDI1259399.1 glycosyltransferase [Aquabacterium sp.]
MILKYVTRTRIPSRVAQSQQISAMALAFSQQIGASFTLASSVGTAPRPSYHQALPLRTISDKGRYLAACLTAGRHVLGSKGPIVIYTRDIFVALTAATLGGQAIYEAHKEPKGRAARICTWVLARLPSIRFVYISQALSNFYQQHYRIPDGRALTAHDGAFPEDYVKLRQTPTQDLREELGLPQNKILIVHTGSLYEGRGAHLFEHLARHSPDVVFVQVGGESEDIDRWSKHYQQLGLENMLFRPRQTADAVRRYQVCADILFYMITKDTSTYWCCSPLKLFEYMASGTPILGSAIGSISEVLDTQNSFVFDPEDHTSIHSALQSMLTFPKEAQRRANVALLQIEQEYSWHIRARRILDFAAGKQVTA